MYYNNTNLAYELEEEKISYESERTAVRPAKKKKNSGLLIFICVVYVVASITSLLFKTASVNEEKAELNRIKNEYEEVLNENKKLEVAINSKVDLRKVEDIAIAELNMNKPKNSQIVYVNTNPMDYGEVIVPVEKEVSRGVFGSLIKTFTGIFAYSN